MKTEKEFWLVTMLIVAVAVFAVASYFRWLNFGLLLGPYRMNHWVSWIASIYIALAVPVFSALRRKSPLKMRALIRIHVYGNLISFLLISIHFASQVSRQPIPDLGTGIALYIVMLILTITGFFNRFRISALVKPQNNRFLHVSVAISFFIIIGIHILHGIGII